MTASAGFGFNLTYGGLNRSWILDGDAAAGGGYVLYADLNGNGDLADDAPLKFQNAGGSHFLIYKTVVTEAQETYPFEIKLEITSDTAPEQSSAKLSVAFYNNTVRRGKIRVGGREVAFGLVGAGGFYNSGSHLVFFDMDGDGRFDRESERSAERYTVAEKHVNFAGVSYRYEVDRFGRSLTLTPLAVKLPDRSTLFPGNPAPDFSFIDTNGQARRLSDYRGKIVLLDFWATWCSPCVAEAPRLAAAYRRLRARGFEIIGVNGDVNETAFRDFITRQGMSWTHLRESFKEGPLQKLYRAETFPVYYLIGRDGTILASQIKSKELIGEIEKHLNN